MLTMRAKIGREFVTPEAACVLGTWGSLHYPLHFLQMFKKFHNKQPG